MTIKKSILFLLFLILSLNIAFSQNSFLANDSLNLNKSKSALLKNKAKISYGLEMGSTFVNLGSGASYNYVSPYILYPLSSKLSLELGMKFSKGNLFPAFKPYEHYNILTANMFQKTFYAKAHYSIIPNLRGVLIIHSHQDFHSFL